MNYSVMTEREVEIELSTSVSEGLKSFTAHDRLIDNGRNVPEKSYAKSSTAVVLSQITNLYTIAFFAMGIITALCDFTKSIWAWVIFFAVAALNMVSGFLRDNQDRKIAVKFDSQRAEECKIIRDGKEMMTDPMLLVKGDIVVLSEGDFVPADLRILRCESLKADESIFVGRNIPIDKQSERVEDDVDASNSPNMLYCGSVIKQGWAFAAVTAVGKDTTLARTRESKSKKLDMHDKFAKSAKSEKLLICLALIMATFVMLFVSITEKNAMTAMLKACTVALCLIPAPVCLVRMLAIRYSNKRIVKEEASLPDDDFAYQIGMTEYVLFDKGGVITNGSMELEERVVSGRDKLEMAVICSDCEFKDSILTGSDIDKATIEALINEGVDAKRILEENERILFMPFDEQRKLMAVVVKKDKGYRIIVKGSVDVIPTLCSHIADGDEIMEMNGEALHKLENISSSMAEKGLKIRALAFRDFALLPENIEHEIKELVFAGALGYREVIVRKTREAVKKLESVFVHPVMVTGDHTITAAAIARQAGIIKKESECISFREIAGCSDEELCEYLSIYKVFSGATREDRERCARVLTANGAVTAVAGEQMCEHSVAINSSVTIGEGEDCDVVVKKADMPKIADVIYKARAMRGNLAFASLLAISVGLCEALVLMYMILTGANIPSSFDMLAVNLFVTFVPCMAVALFASVHCETKNQKLLAAKCILAGFIGAVMAILSGGSIVVFAAFYAVLDSLRICMSFKNLEKGKQGIIGILICAAALILAIVCTNMGLGAFKTESTMTVLICALIGVIINGVLSQLKLKGRDTKHV